MLAILRVFLVVGAGVGLWRLWVRTAGVDPRVRAIVGAGFVLRVVLAQALFWISFLHLPLGRTLQLGGGFWFFAPDARMYLDLAQTALHDGPSAVLFPAHRLPSHVFVQVIALSVAAFGDVASIAILVNGALYLATCGFILRLAGPARPVSPAVLVAIAAVAFGPGTVLWSLQLLKDTLLMGIAAAILVAFQSWERMWNSELRTLNLELRTSGFGLATRAAGCAAGLAIGFYALAGLRWYFALVIWVASLPFFALVAWRARRWRVVWAASAIVLLLLSQCVRWGGFVDLPIVVRRLLDPRTASAVILKPFTVTNSISNIRRGFERSRAATAIVSGPAVPDPHSTIPRVTMLLIPRVVGQGVGIARVEGGRGLWLFGEIDTIVFDLVLLYAIASCVSVRRPYGASPPALFVVPVVTFLVLLPLMAYTVNNFGTLVRLRQMLYFMALIAPVTLAGARDTLHFAKPPRRL